MVHLLTLPVETLRTLAEHDRRWRIDLYVRLLAAFLSIIGIIIFAATIHQSKARYGGNDWTDGLAIAPVSFNFIFERPESGVRLHTKHSARRFCTIEPAKPGDCCSKLLTQMYHA